MPLDGPEAAAEKAAQVLGVFRESGEPVFHVQHLSPEGASFLEEGSDGAEIADAVAPVGDEVVIRKRAPTSASG